MDGRIRDLLRELRQSLEKIYGARLRGVYLFGSHARGEEDEESDVDVLVVLDVVDHYGAEVDRTAALVSDLSLRSAASVSVVFVGEADWLSADTPFLGNVRQEAVAA